MGVKSLVHPVQVRRADGGIVSTVASVAGGVLGLAIGIGLWQLLEPWFFQYVPGFSR